MMQAGDGRLKEHIVVTAENYQCVRVMRTANSVRFAIDDNAA